MNLREIDLNLLTVFDAIFREGNQARAAEKLGMSQPAMSNALSRLRAILGDPLFVRTAQGMAPTATAQSLAGPVRHSLETLLESLERTRRGGQFDQSSAKRTIVLVVEDIGEAILMPRFVDWLVRAAPSINIRVRRDYGGSDATAKFNSGSIDLAIQHGSPLDPSLCSQHLLDDEFVSMVRRDHPTIGDALTIEEYVSLSHVVYGRLGRKGARKSQVDAQLRRLGLSRKIAYEAFAFQSMPLVVNSSDLICTLPSRIASKYATAFNLRILKTPVALPPLSLFMVWGKVMDRDKGHRWLRQSLHAVAKDIA